MDFNAYYDIDCKSLHGEGASLQFSSVTNITNKSIQGINILDVVKVMTKGMI
jgi:hypothetical protein